MGKQCHPEVRPLKSACRGKSVRDAILIPMFNKTFYKFFFGFLAIIASMLIFILVVGAKTQS